jgi:hypothetical protein
MSSIPFFATAERNPIVPGSGKPPRGERISALLALAQVTPASRLEVRPAPEMVSSGVRELDALTGGWPRGCLSEICGNPSSGRTSVLLAALVAATQRQEACALVDTSDMFDPASAATAGVNFERLLWVRCDSCPKNSPRRHRDTEGKIADNSQIAPAIEQALRVTDLLLQSGGLGLVVIDLGGVPFLTARRIPLTSWFRFQRAVEHTPTVLLAITPAPCAQTCATVLLEVKQVAAFSSQRSADFARASDSTVEGHGLSHAEWAATTSGPSAPGVPAHTQLLDGLPLEVELLRSRLRKPVRSVTTAFETKTIRAG